MSDDQHPVCKLLGPLVDIEEFRAYLAFVASLVKLPSAALMDVLQKQEKLSWQWCEVLSQLRAAISRADWNDVIVYRENPVTQAIAEDRLRQIASEQTINWLMAFLNSPTDSWVIELLCEELRKRVAALKLSEPIPEWFMDALRIARAGQKGYLGILERKAMQLMSDEAYDSMAD